MAHTYSSADFAAVCAAAKNSTIRRKKAVHTTCVFTSAKTSASFFTPAPSLSPSFPHFQ